MLAAEFARMCQGGLGAGAVVRTADDPTARLALEGCFDEI